MAIEASRWRGPCRLAADFLAVQESGLFAQAGLRYNHGMVRSVTEADILESIVAPDASGLTADAARCLLELRFDRDTTQRIRRLLQKNNRGSISAEERLTLEKYLRVGQLLDLLHAKARLSLQRQSDSA